MPWLQKNIVIQGQQSRRQGRFFGMTPDEQGARSQKFAHDMVHGLRGNAVIEEVDGHQVGQQVQGNSLCSEGQADGPPLMSPGFGVVDFTDGRFQKFAANHAFGPTQDLQEPVGQVGEFNGLGAAAGKKQVLLASGEKKPLNPF
jgi:hypothetical protein